MTRCAARWAPHERTPLDTTLLRRALTGNAVFSLGSALVAVVLAGPLSDAFDIPAAVLVVLGIALVPWALLGWYTSRTLDRRFVVAIIGGDILWVIGTVVLLAGFPDAMSGAGRTSAAVVGLIVAGFAVTQTIGLRRSTAS